MIQELLIKGDQKPALPSNNASLDGSPSSSPSSAESLRCPRCDSANTKFCYYNNYNLTQPRHFCKTCRRYWTKGGALRNVPIGGGCRKNRSSSLATAVAKSPGKLKTLSSVMSRTGLFNGFETAAHHHHPHNNPLSSANPNPLWAPPHNHTTTTNNHHFLSLLRANQNPNHHQGSSNNNNYNSFRVSGLDPAHAPSAVFRNQAGQGPTHGSEAPYNGLQDLYQRLRSSISAPSTGCYFPEKAPLIRSVTSANYTSLANSAILESGPVGTAGELGFWNASNLSLPTHDVPTANGGAYPASFIN